VTGKNTAKNDIPFLEQKFGIYILGAGFSKPAGLPLAKELWKAVLERGLKLSGRSMFFRNDLIEFIEYKEKCDGKRLEFEDVDPEEFLGFLDIEHFLGLRGSDTWSRQGNEAQIVVKTLIGEILTKATPSIDRVPEEYLKFARLLKPNDIVLTFNYDVLLERALESTGTPYRVFPQRYITDPEVPGRLWVDDRDEVVVMKMHGSIDWFDGSIYKELEEDRVRRGVPKGSEDFLFGEPNKFEVYPLIEGPRHEDDPLAQIYKVRLIDRLYAHEIMFSYTPEILNPSSMKILYSKMYRDFWYSLGRAGVFNFRLAIVGYSLPKQDEYARQVIYRIVSNYQTAYWGDSQLKHKKTPLILIDCLSSDADKKGYKGRYSFVNWERAITHFSGFNRDAIELLNG
jgi:hypothetical protein